MSKDEEKKLYYVSCTDKFMSGWGKAEGRISKFVIVCDTMEQALRVAFNLRKEPNFIYVNVTEKKPYFPPKRYRTDFKRVEECPLYNK